MAAGLDGLRVLVPESRELDLFASMLERQGAVPIRCPLVTILDLEDTGPAEAWLRRLAGGAFDDLILFTGEGVRRMMRVADGAGIADAVRDGLARTRKIVRGPKPVKALRELGLGPDITAAEPTTEGLLTTLAALDLSGRRFGMQCYPGQDDEIDRHLAGRGVTVERVLPYRYASHEEDARVAEAIDRMADGNVDLIAFTARPQVGRLRDVAARHGREEALRTAMSRTRIAAVGPVVAQAVTSAGWTVAISPDDNFHLKPLIAEIRMLFGAAATMAWADTGYD